jgi:predicted regulator of Ras-like GTPase activity (Roadblock/LC7/MglB family)
MPPTTSPYDTTMLDLPLKVVTPLFVNELKSSKPQKKVAVDVSIPNLFHNTPQPETTAPAASAPHAPVHAPAAVATPAPARIAPPAAQSLPTAAPAPQQPALRPSAFTPPAPSAPSAPPSAAKPGDTNYYTWRDDSDQPEATEVFTKKESGAPSTAFLNRYATPNEIVTKAASFGGVDGALIALPDGLLVASRIPASMNADTIAAFLPQIFGRVSQCTRELRLGDLNNLNFTVGNVPWKIFRVGSIYFAVFGRPGEPLPTSQLVGLAAELDRKGK